MSCKWCEPDLIANQLRTVAIWKPILMFSLGNGKYKLVVDPIFEWGICPKRRTKGNWPVRTQQTVSSASTNKYWHGEISFDMFVLCIFSEIYACNNEKTLKMRLKLENRYSLRSSIAHCGQLCWLTEHTVYVLCLFPWIRRLVLTACHMLLLALVPGTWAGPRHCKSLSVKIFCVWRRHGTGNHCTMESAMHVSFFYHKDKCYYEVTPGYKQSFFCNFLTALVLLHLFFFTIFEIIFFPSAVGEKTFPSFRLCAFISHKNEVPYYQLSSCD